MRGFASLMLAGSIFAAAVPASAANLLANGSFENGSNGLAGWTLGGDIGNQSNNVRPVAISYNARANYPIGAYGEAVPTTNVAANPSFDAAGDRALYFAADHAVQTLTQTVNLIAGTSYTVGFDFYLPRNGANNRNNATLTASVGGQSFASFTASAQPAQTWQLFRTDLVAATSGPVDFKFAFQGFGYPAKDFVIDRVFLAPTAAVPEPATWAMLIGGFGMAGAAMRRRRTTVAFG